jgi:small subunit ribosomal protein S20
MAAKFGPCTRFALSGSAHEYAASTAAGLGFAPSGSASQAPAIVTRRSMANIASQKKRNARTLREHEENQRLRSAVKTYFKRLEAAVAAGDSATADAEHQELCSRIDTAVRKGALHRRNGARKKARAARSRAGA